MRWPAHAADIRITQGRLGNALRTYQEALHLARDGAGSVLLGTADMHVGMSHIVCERNDQDAATQHFCAAKSVGSTSAGRGGR